jgi:hypothetical protein
MRYQELLFSASVLGAAIALHNRRHPREYALRTVDFPARNPATNELITTIMPIAGPAGLTDAGPARGSMVPADRRQHTARLHWPAGEASESAISIGCT